MPPDTRAIAGVDDSKRLAPADRVRLAVRIRERAVALGLGAASVREIDRVNIYHASVLAMKRALGRLPTAPEHILVDGRPIRTLGVPHQAVVHGDARCYAIACASIVAKVTRDRLMEALGRRHPAYRWERNAGYATQDHIGGLAAAGLTPHHRRSFCRIEQLTLDLEAAAAEEMSHELAEAGLIGDARFVSGFADRDALDDGDATFLDEDAFDDDELGDGQAEPLIEELATGELLDAPAPPVEDVIEAALDDVSSSALQPTARREQPGAPPA